MNKNELRFKLIGFLGPLMVKLLGLTYRYTFLKPEYKVLPDGGGIYIFWHGKFFVPMLVHRNQNVVVMVSEHKDGEMITRVLHRMGQKTVRGSSTRGGKKAFADMLEQLEKDYWCVITPDGPRGPREVMKTGTARLSAAAGKGLLLLNWYASSKWQFASWDKFELPKPFARIFLAYEMLPPISSDTDPEATSEKLAERLKLLEKRCYEAARNL